MSVGRGCVRERWSFSARHRRADAGDQPADQLLLTTHDGGQTVFQAFDPQNPAGLGFRQLDIELETPVADPVGARQHVVGTQVRADLLQRGAAPAEGGCRQARYELEV